MGDNTSNPLERKKAGRKSTAEHEQMQAIVKQILEDNLTTNHSITQLYNLAKSRGFSASRSTLARHVKDLDYTKIDGCYVTADSGPQLERRERIQKKHHRWLRSYGTQVFDSASCLLPIQTSPGYARAAANSIQRLFKNRVLGVFADYDMLLLVVAGSETDSLKLRKEIKDICEKNAI